MDDITLVPAPVAPDLGTLLAGASWRGPMDKHTDSLSGSVFERAVIGGTDHIVKHAGYELDWLARALGDRDCFARVLWRTGLLGSLPDVIDHAIVGVADEPAIGGAALLMRDVGATLVPPGSGPLPVDQHVRFLTHMAALHAAFWGFRDTYGLLRVEARYAALTPATGEREARLGYGDPVPRALAGGWAGLRAAVPGLAEDALALANDAAPLARAFAETPATLVHGDWKAGNLGSHPDGRTVLLDWGWPGEAGALVDLAWYIAVNCERLPMSKEDTITTYRRALEATGVDTAGWWDRQLALALLGGFLQLGWSKTGDPAELAWWTARGSPGQQARTEAEEARRRIATVSTIVVTPNARSSRRPRTDGRRRR